MSRRPLFFGRGGRRPVREDQGPLKVVARSVGALVVLAILAAGWVFWTYRGPGPKAREGAATTVILPRGSSVGEIDYINAHGTSTPLGDEIELGAVERMLGNAAAKATMSSTKSATGHLLGAAGAIEAAFSVLAIRDQIAPPTINLDNPSVETPIDLIAHKAKPMEINVALSNSFGFGGTNASVIFKKYT